MALSQWVSNAIVMAGLRNRSTLLGYGVFYIRVLSERFGHGGSGVCVGQTESYLKDMDMTGVASAWVMARRRPV